MVEYCINNFVVRNFDTKSVSVLEIVKKYMNCGHKYNSFHIYKERKLS